MRCTVSRTIRGCRRTSSTRASATGRTDSPTRPTPHRRGRRSRGPSARRAPPTSCRRPRRPTWVRSAPTPNPRSTTRRSRSRGRESKQVFAQALPDRFVAIGFRGGQQIFRKWGTVVADQLAVSPLFDPLLMEDPDQDLILSPAIARGWSTTRQPRPPAWRSPSRRPTSRWRADGAGRRAAHGAWRRLDADARVRRRARRLAARQPSAR